MELTRRDAMLALAGGGVAVGAKAVGEEVAGTDAPTGDGASLSGTELATLVAAAEMLYPSAVDPSREFVETYTTRRFTDRATELRTAIRSLREAARRETGGRFEALPVGRREAVLRATGADRAYPDPGGTTSQRLRYYVVNGLLYALYASPRGAELVGSANPEGYPGGQEAYQRRPER
ncbi:MAG: gluconate 2-dehydrogenase subunit 3 family protein [Haloarculaceae archaeon]